MPACVLEQVPEQLLLEGSLIALQRFRRTPAESQTVYWFGTYVRATEAVRRASISLASLRASSTGWTCEGEGTAEHPLDEVLYALLEVSQDADGYSPFRVREDGEHRVGRCLDRGARADSLVRHAVSD